MGVITISRKMGSEGTYIGRKVAKRLNMAYADKAFISKIMREYGFSAFKEVYDETPTFWDKFLTIREQTIDFLAKTEQAIGKADNVVIVGRGGFGIFENYNDVLNIRTKAPLEIRVKRQMAEHDISYEEAYTHVLENDKVRKNFVESDFRFDYQNTNSFDMIINTAIIDPDKSVDYICEVYDSLIKNGRSSTSKNLKDLEVDPILLKYVREELDKTKDAL
ncbi:MAG: AAA family ATPase [Pleomorphochaeta sp.]